jgi:hypothetical protein
VAAGITSRVMAAKKKPTRKPAELEETYEYPVMIGRPDKTWGLDYARLDHEHSTAQEIVDAYDQQHPDLVRGARLGVVCDPASRKASPKAKKTARAKMPKKA